MGHVMRRLRCPNIFSNCHILPDFVHFCTVFRCSISLFVFICFVIWYLKLFVFVWPYSDPLNILVRIFFSFFSHKYVHIEVIGRRRKLTISERSLPSFRKSFVDVRVAIDVLSSLSFHLSIWVSIVVVKVRYLHIFTDIENIPCSLSGLRAGRARRATSTNQIVESRPKAPPEVA